GISPLPEKVAAITNFPKPDTVKELRLFFVICNFYRRFIPHAARTLAVLISNLMGAKRMTEHASCGQKTTAAFEKRKKDLAKAIDLYHHAADALLAIVVDTSDTAVGAALHQ
ncbi:retrovirus-related Pol polyprotein from transposon 297, partial [Nephila pilipes]